MTSNSSIFISKNHDQYIIIVRENGSYSIYKNGNTLEPLDIEEVPFEIRESVSLDIKRQISNLNAKAN